MSPRDICKRRAAILRLLPNQPRRPRRGRRHRRKRRRVAGEDPGFGVRGGWGWSWSDGRRRAELRFNCIEPCQNAGAGVVPAEDVDQVHRVIGEPADLVAVFAEGHGDDILRIVDVLDALKNQRVIKVKDEARRDIGRIRFGIVDIRWAVAKNRGAGSRSRRRLGRARRGEGGWGDVKTTGAVDGAGKPALTFRLNTWAK